MQKVAHSTCNQPQCSDKTCLRRHPRACKYFSTFDSCKFREDCSCFHKVKTYNGFAKKKFDMLKFELQSDNQVTKLVSKS